MTAVFAAHFTACNVVTLDAWLRHRYISKEVLTVLAQRDRCDCVASIDQAHVRTIDIAVLLLIQASHIGGCRPLALAPLQVVRLSHLRILSCVALRLVLVRFERITIRLGLIDRDKCALFKRHVNTVLRPDP